MAYISFNNSSNFSTIAQGAVAASFKSLCFTGTSTASFANAQSFAAGPRRGKLYDILVGTNGTPADNFMEWQVARATVGCTLAWVGSLSSGSSQFTLDPADANIGLFLAISASAETNIVVTGSPWYVGVNQRASYRWVAAPGSEIVSPANSSATGNNGLALQTRSAAYTGTATGNIMVQEQ